jgi:hypothetical protein
MTPQVRQCERCHRVIQARGPTAVRFCPTCGERFAQPLEPVGDGSPGGSRRTSIQAVLGLVVAVLALVVQPFAFPLGLVSVLLGLTAQKSIERSKGILGGRGFAIAAIVLGLISILIWFMAAVARSAAVRHGSASF